MGKFRWIRLLVDLGIEKDAINLAEKVIVQANEWVGDFWELNPQGMILMQKIFEHNDPDFEAGR